MLPHNPETSEINAACPMVQIPYLPTLVHQNHKQHPSIQNQKEEPGKSHIMTRDEGNSCLA